MNKETLKNMHNLAVNIFDDKEYAKFNKLLNNKKFNKLRLYIDEKISFLQVITKLEPYTSSSQFQLTCCNKMEDIIIDLYVESLEVNM